MATSDALREIFTAARPLVEQWLDVAEQIGALREVATNKGLDWSQVKALLKAQIQDERDEAGDGKRVRRIVEKAEFASAYADMLGLANMNEKKYFADDSAEVEVGIPATLPAHDAETGEIQEQPQTAGEKVGGFPVAAAPVSAEETGSYGEAAKVADKAGEVDPSASPVEVSPSIADVSPNGEPAVDDANTGGSDDDRRLMALTIDGGAGAQTTAAPAAVSEPFTPPAFLLKDHPVRNPRCEKGGDCKYAFHPHQISCSTCSTAWQIAQRKARAAA